MRLGALLGLGVTLVGCAPLDLGPGTRALALLDGAVVAQGPEGYCVDRRTSRPATGFAVMGGCAIIAALPIMPRTEALITVQFGGAESGAVEGREAALVALLRSARGVALLSSDGQPEAILVDGIEQAPGIVLVRFTDTGPPLVAGLEQVEWRAFLDLRGRLTTVSLRGFTRAPLGQARGLELMAEAVATLRAANVAPVTDQGGDPG